MIDQQLIDRAARQQAAQRAASGLPPLKEDEGGTLGPIAGLVWRSGFEHLHGWQPSEPAPVPLDPRDQARRAHSETLRDEALAHINPALVEAARAALDTSKAANDRLQALEAEKRTLYGDLSESAVLASLTIDRRLDAARKVAQQAGDQSTAALTTVRTALLEYYARVIRHRETLVARKLDEQAEQIEQKAGDIRVATANARSGLENYLPEPAAAPVEPAKPRRRIFEKKAG